MEKDTTKPKRPNDLKHDIIISAVLCAGFLTFALTYFVFDDNYYDAPISASANEISEVSEAPETGEVCEEGAEKPAEPIETGISPDDDAAVTDVCGTEAQVVFPLDVNTATVSELVMVKGIGPVTAQKIVDYRDLNGYFYSLDELVNVDGIGEKRISSFYGYLYVDSGALPDAPENYYEAGAAVTTVTTVPDDYSAEEERETSLPVTSVTEEFYMETEEFVTGTDGDDFESFEITQGTWDYYMTSATAVSVTEKYYPDFPLDLNTVSAEDLMYINGVGEVTARRIVDYARTVGFSCVDDLLNVSGIGESKLEMIKPYVYVDPRYARETAPTDTVSEDVSETVSEITPEITVTTISVQEQTEVYRVNINTCGKADLTQLPGIDESKADEILALRDDVGYFRKIEDLTVVLTDSEMSAIWDYVYV